MADGNGNEERAEQLFQAAALCQQRGEIDSALDLYRRVIATAPRRAGAYMATANILKDQGKRAAAAAYLRRATMAIAPSAAAYADLGLYLCRLQQYEAAGEAIARSLAIEPRRVGTLVNQGILLHKMGDIPGALRAYDHAIAVEPENPFARWNRGLTLLADGDLARGFGDYEYRARIPGGGPRDPGIALWQGENLYRKTLIVHAEQGIGDTLQFLRYVPFLAAAGARVVFGPQLELMALLKDFPGIAELAPPGSTLAADFHVPLMSLAHRFGTTLESIPCKTPYLVPPAGLSATLTQPRGSKLRIGVVWAGRPAHQDDHARSMPFEELLALADLPSATFYSLQIGERAQDIAACGAAGLIRDLSPQLTDFAVTAAVLRELDLVVTVDTAVAHLAGAMARPCFVLLPFCADWRWLRQREDSPWYPTLRLFRQASPGDWAGVMPRLRAAIEQLL
jgi:Tetratricopeptide repeat/Glycosyltransferase family 9 (heptosyltransferase)